MKSYVNFIIGIIIVFTVISPFTKLINFNVNLNKEIDDFSNNIVTKEGVEVKQNKQIEDLFKNNLANEIKRIIKDNTDYNVKEIYISTKPDEENILLIENVNIILDAENQTKKNEIKVERIHFGNESMPVSNESYDFSELKYLILDYMQIDEEKLIISVEKREEKHGGDN